MPNPVIDINLFHTDLDINIYHLGHFINKGWDKKNLDQGKVWGKRIKGFKERLRSVKIKVNIKTREEQERQMSAYGKV